MQAILDFLNGFVGILYNILAWLLHAVGWLLIQIIGAIVLGALLLVYAIVSAIDVASWVVNLAVGWGLLSPDIGYFITATGFTTGLSMLGFAFTVRFTLNLIPSWATRV